MGHRGDRWGLLIALLLVAGCGDKQPGDGAKAPGQTTAATAESVGPEIEKLPSSVAGHTFKSYYAWRYYAPDGTFENSDIYGTIETGHWWMKGGEVCAKLDVGMAKPLCSKPDFSKLTPRRSPVR